MSAVLSNPSPAPGEALGRPPGSDAAAQVQAGLALLARMLPGVRCALAVGPPAPGGGATLAVWPAGASPSTGLAALARRAAQPSPQSPGVILEPEPLRLAAPVRAGGALGAIAVELPAPVPSGQRATLETFLEWGAAWLRLACRDGAGGRTGDVEVHRTVLAALAPPSLREAALTLATALAEVLGCDRVCLGIGRPGALSVRAFSGNTSFDRRTKLVRAVEACMNEASAETRTIAFPAPRAARPGRAPAALSEEHGDVAVLTVAVALGPGAAAAVTCERFAPPAFAPATIALAEEILALAAPALELRRREALGPVATLHEALRRALARSRLGLLLAAALAALLLALASIESAHRVRATATVHGSFQQSVVAPFDGYVAAAHARAGDRVQAGVPLVSLQVRELALEREAVAREREALDRQYRRALSRLERADARILLEQMAQADARIALLDDHIARAEVTAPFAAVVVAGDLARAIGSPVERGQVLFEVAPLEGYEVDLDVDERDVARVRAGQRGELVLAALPGQALALEVEKVSPVSRLEGGRNVFRAAARIADPPADLRPGMAGVAKIGVGERSLAWIWSHRLVDWLRLRLWSWLP